MTTTTPYTIDRLVRIGLTLASIAGIIWLLGYLSEVLVPFAIAFLIAYLLHPLVCLTQRRVRHRGAAIFIVLSGVLTIVVGAGLILIPMMVSEVSNTGVLLKRFAEDNDYKQRAAEILPPRLVESIKENISRQRLADLVHEAQFWAFLQNAARKVLPKALDIISGTASLLFGMVGMFVILLYIIFLLLDYDKVKKEWEDLLPPAFRKPVLEFLTAFDQAMNRYFRAQALVAAIVAICFAVGFSIIGLPMGILLGILLGLLNMVPYLQIIGLVPAAGLALMKSLETGASFWVILGSVIVVFIVVQIIQDALLTPRIMGSLTGLSPAMILLSISVWGKLLGFLGLVIAIPMTCLFLAYYQRILTGFESATVVGNATS